MAFRLFSTSADTSGSIISSSFSRDALFLSIVGYFLSEKGQAAFLGFDEIDAYELF